MSLSSSPSGSLKVFVLTMGCCLTGYWSSSSSSIVSGWRWLTRLIVARRLASVWRLKTIVSIWVVKLTFSSQLPTMSFISCDEENGDILCQITNVPLITRNTFCRQQSTSISNISINPESNLPSKCLDCCFPLKFWSFSRHQSVAHSSPENVISVSLIIVTFFTNSNYCHKF